MARPRPGWLVAVCAAVLAVSAWLPWLTTNVNGGGRASAIGGSTGSLVLPARFDVGQLIVILTSTLLVAGAVTARRLSVRWASVAALLISLLIAALTGWYYHLNVSATVSAGYGWYIGAAGAACAVGFSAWALIDTVRARRPPTGQR